MSMQPSYVKFFAYDRTMRLGNSYEQADKIEELHKDSIIAWEDEVRDSMGYLLGWNIRMKADLLDE